MIECLLLLQTKLHSLWSFSFLLCTSFFGPSSMLPEIFFNGFSSSLILLLAVSNLPSANLFQLITTEFFSFISCFLFFFKLSFSLFKFSFFPCRYVRLVFSFFKYIYSNQYNSIVCINKSQ